ncbi:hypothetical protein PSAC2689_80125 [Paraburkholderia sacchari]
MSENTDTPLAVTCVTGNSRRQGAPGDVHGGGSLLSLCWIMSIPSIALPESPAWAHYGDACEVSGKGPVHPLNQARTE